MNWFKRDPLVGMVVLLSFLTIGFEGWLLHKTSLQAADGIKVLEQKKREGDTLQHQIPAPSEENEQAIIRELTTTKEKVAAAEIALTGAVAQTLPAASAKSVDAYFEIADFVEKTRGLAAQAKVAIRTTERFGLGSQASEGPVADLLPATLRQTQAIKFLVEALLEAHPSALISVQRERPLNTRQSQDRNQLRPAGNALLRPAIDRSEATDFFELGQMASLRSPGKIEADAFKLEFSGQTAALRSFLNRLSSCELPFVVRSVEIDQLGAATSNSTPPMLTASVPIVTHGLSRFRVIVELIRPLDETERSES